jgi:hypothetical protein
MPSDIVGDKPVEKHVQTQPPDAKKIAFVKAITGSHQKMLELEALIGPQDNVSKLEAVLLGLGEQKVNELASRLGSVDPKGGYYPKDVQDKDIVELRVFTSPLTPANMLPLLELQTEVKTIAESHGKKAGALAYSLKLQESERDRWSKLLNRGWGGDGLKAPNVDLRDADNVAKRFGRLTEPEWRMLDVVVREGLQESFDSADQDIREYVNLLANEAGLADAESAIHVVRRAVSVFRGDARVHVDKAVVDGITGLLEQGRKAEAAEQQKTDDRHKDEVQADAELNNLFYGKANPAGIKLAVEHGILPDAALKDANAIMPKLNLGEKHTLAAELKVRKPKDMRALLDRKIGLEYPPGHGRRREYVNAALKIVGDLSKMSYSDVFYRTNRYRLNELKLVLKNRFPQEGQPSSVEDTVARLDKVFKNRGHSKQTVEEMEQLVIRGLTEYIIFPDK